MLAWFGADVLKVERMHTGDNTRIQLRDIPNADALYFTMVNSNKRSLEIDTKMPEGKAILEQLIRGADVMIENMSPGGMAVFAPTFPQIGERVIAYIDHVGRLEGVCTRHFDNGFASTIAASKRRSTKCHASTADSSCPIMVPGILQTSIRQGQEIEQPGAFAIRDARSAIRTPSRLFTMPFAAWAVSNF